MPHWLAVVTAAGTAVGAFLVSGISSLAMAPRAHADFEDVIVQPIVDAIDHAVSLVDPGLAASIDPGVAADSLAAAASGTSVPDIAYLPLGMSGNTPVIDVSAGGGPTIPDRITLGQECKPSYSNENDGSPGPSWPTRSGLLGDLPRPLTPPPRPRNAYSDRFRTATPNRPTRGLKPSKATPPNPRHITFADRYIDHINTTMVQVVHYSCGLTLATRHSMFGVAFFNRRPHTRPL